jgi:ribosomal-protein-serine acetyltransferase
MFIVPIDENINLKLIMYNEAEVFFNLIEKNREYLQTFMPRISENKALTKTQKVIELFFNQLKENNGFRCGIYYQNSLIGVCGLKYIDWINKSTEIMYWIDREYSGKGITSKCVKKLIHLVFNSYKLNRIVIKSSKKNRSSIRIAEKCNFKKEGLLREEESLNEKFTDVYIFSILKREYKGDI